MQSVMESAAGLLQALKIPILLQPEALPLKALVLGFMAAVYVFETYLDIRQYLVTLRPVLPNALKVRTRWSYCVNSEILLLNKF